MSTSRSNRPQSKRTRARRPSEPPPDRHRDADDPAAAKPPAPAPRPPGPPPAIETVGLAKRYGDAPALWPLDLRVEAGERISLIGHNGSGKTTLMRMLVGMLEPTEGTATIASHPIGSIEARAAVSYLADQPVFYDDLSVWEHLEYIARLHGTDDWEQQAVDLVDMVGLMDRVDDLPMTFSRGLKQKAALTMAFVRPFDVMLIDEPFVGLDGPGQEILVEVLADVAEQGAAVLCSTHQLDLAPKATRCIGLRDGVQAYDGPATPEKIRSLVSG
jgi:ABC-2 type transport system ATP-binding protein